MVWVLAIVAVAPSLTLQLAALVPLGALSVTFAAGINSSLQLAVDPAMRGRVMALYSMVFLGSTPIGSLLVGWLAEVSGPRAGLAVGAAAALVAAAGGRMAYRRSDPSARRSAEYTLPAPPEHEGRRLRRIQGPLARRRGWVAQLVRARHS